MPEQHLKSGVYGMSSILQQGEKECSYYLKTGQCKFGTTCKFHHPQPAGMSMPAPAPLFYPTVQSPSVPVPEQGAGSSSGYRATRPPLVPGSYVPGTYGPVLLSPGVVPMPSWSSYSVSGSFTVIFGQDLMNF